MLHSYPDIRSNIWFLRKQNIKLDMNTLEGDELRVVHSVSRLLREGRGRETAGRGGKGDEEVIILNLKILHNHHIKVSGHLYTC